VYDSVVSSSIAGTMVLLVVIGFCIYGPQVLLVGTAPADLAHRGTSAAAAGFVNFIGYMGAATGDVVTGYYSAPEHGGWQTAIYIWAGWAFAGAAITALMWNTTARRIGLLPALVPKVAAVGLLLVAGGAVVREGGSLVLEIGTFAAALLAVGAIAPVGRVFAAPGLVVSLVGLVAVFVASARGEPSGTWDATVAMAAYGLAAIAAVMILVEKKDE
jgi:hypothetical protein